MHLIIASRANPPLPLTQYRGQGIILEIRVDDLRFRLDETTTLLEKSQDMKLSTKDVSTLNERTGGWVTGLKMAALSIPRQEDIPGFINTLSSSQRYIMDYLIEEVLKKQTKKIQDFLLKTSVLEKLTAPLCDVVSGHNDSRDILLELEHNNMFIIPLDESRKWYRYEPLFKDLLNHQLEITFEEQEITELHRKASQWYEINNYSGDAIHHALIARDWERATRLITAANEQKRLNGEFVTVLNWLQRIPEEVMYSDMTLCSMYSQLLIVTMQLDAAAVVIDNIARIAENNEEFSGLASSLQCFLAFNRGNPDLALEFGNKALPILPADQLEIRTIVNLYLGFIHWQKGNFKEAKPFLSDTYEIGKKIGHSYAAAASLSLLASADLLSTGKLRQAVERFQQCIELAGPTPATASSHQMLGWILYEWNDLENAITQVQRSIDLGKLAGGPDFLARQYAFLAQCKITQDDESGAMKAMEESRLIAHSTEMPVTRIDQAVHRIQIALVQNDSATAFEWGNKLAEDIDALPYYHSHIPARLLIARGEMTAAAEKLQAICEEVNRGSTQIVKIILYQALAADTTKSALHFLTDVFAITEPEGCIRTFVDEGRLLTPLLKQAVSRGIYSEYASKLLAIIESEERQKKTAQVNQALLSKRELEVLQLLADGLSNHQIADILVISLSTTKNHVHNILEKLNVQRRTQAVSRARELQLL